MTTDSPRAHRVFVYGTLMTGFGNHSRLLDHDGARYEGKARTAVNARLGDVGAFPAVTELRKGSCPVVGEVYTVDDDTLARLDMLEGVPSLYTRQQVEVLDEDDDSMGLAWIYVWGRDNETLPVIRSGDWRAHNENQRRRERHYFGPGWGMR